MIRSYTIKRTEKLLREVKCYRASAEYYSSLLDCGALADGQITAEESDSLKKLIEEIK